MINEMTIKHINIDISMFGLMIRGGVILFLKRVAGILVR